MLATPQLTTRRLACLALLWASCTSSTSSKRADTAEPSLSDSQSAGDDTASAGEDAVSADDTTPQSDTGKPPPEDVYTPPPLDCAALGREAGPAPDACGACLSGSDALVPLSCSSNVPGLLCDHWTDGDVGSDSSAACEYTPEICTADDGTCNGSCLPTLAIAFEFGGAVTPGGLRFLSDWWKKRPEEWEVWVSDSVDTKPGSGAVKVASGNGHPAPWQCVSGDPCTDDVPAELCCPDGTTAPQRIEEGALIAKWDVFHFQGNTEPGRVVWLVIPKVEDRSDLYMREVTFSSAACADPCGAACAPGVACTMEGDTPVCGACPPGTHGDGKSCQDDDGCAEAPCYPGVACTDQPAPSTGYTCGPCPAGTSGDGVTCTALTCTPGCSDLETCEAGACVKKPCADQGACPGGACFEGKCTFGTCEESCVAKYGQNPKWVCEGAGKCRKLECGSTAECGGGQVCLSSYNDQRAVFDRECKAAGSTPCTSGCASYQLCSKDSGSCSP